MQDNAIDKQIRNRLNSILVRFDHSYFCNDPLRLQSLNSILVRFDHNDDHQD